MRAPGRSAGMREIGSPAGVGVENVGERSLTRGDRRSQKIGPSGDPEAPGTAERPGRDDRGAAVRRWRRLEALGPCRGLPMPTTGA